MKNELSILITDDHDVVRKGTVLILEKNFMHLTIYQACDFKKTISVLKKKTIDLILLDIKIPGGDSPKMISRIRTVQKNVKILMFSALEGKYHAVPYIQAGANGYLNKNKEEVIIVKAIKQVLSTGQYVSSSVKNVLIDSMFGKKPYALEEVLSKQEFEVARFLKKGLSNSEISNRLNIHMSTVSTYKKRIFNKLNIGNLAELIELFRTYHK